MKLSPVATRSPIPNQNTNPRRDSNMGICQPIQSSTLPLMPMLKKTALNVMRGAYQCFKMHLPDIKAETGATQSRVSQNTSGSLKSSQNNLGSASSGRGEAGSINDLERQGPPASPAIKVSQFAPCAFKQSSEHDQVPPVKLYKRDIPGAQAVTQKLARPVAIRPPSNLTSF